MEAGFPFGDRYDWKTKVKLGEGAYGVVFKTKKLTSQEYVAIKQMDMSQFTDKVLIQALNTEIELMKNLKDEHLLKMQDAEIGKKYTYIVLELCDGDLRKKMNQGGGRIKEDEAIQIYSQILKGFKVLTDLGYIHRDIKPQNTLYKGNVYKVADFGFSCKADINCIKRLDMCCGTPLYMAPQLLSEQAYTAKSDIWSLGIMLYEFIFGYAPWTCRSLDSYRYNIMTKPLSFPYNGKIGENTKDFIKKCLTVDQKSRIGWKELFEHPLVAEKNKGEPVQPVKIQKSAVEIMKRIQQSAARKHIDVKAILQQRNIDKMDEKKFFEICKLIDPTISSFEARILFESLDTSKDKFVDFNEFKGLMLQSDFRDADDIASRYMAELIDVAKRRNLQLNKLFKSYDKNSSGSIERYEFTRMVRQLLPRMSDENIEKIWQKFDKDKNNKIELKEFIHEMTYGTADINVSVQVKTEKATRCLTALKGAIKYYGVKLEEVLRIFDTNKDQKLSIKEFQQLVTTIDKKLPIDELRLMFDYLDADKNGYIAIKELRPILS